jgi:hypothetical protein
MTDKKDDKLKETPKEEKKEEVKKPEDKFFELKKNLVLLEKASKDKDFKITASLTKNLKKLRKMYELPDVVLALSFYMPDLFFRIQLPTQPTNVAKDMKIEDMLHCTTARSEEMMSHPEC